MWEAHFSADSFSCKYIYNTAVIIHDFNINNNDYGQMTFNKKLFD